MLPNVQQRHFRFDPARIDDTCGFGPRPVVCDDDFIRKYRLTRDALQSQIECRWPVVRRDD